MSYPDNLKYASSHEWVRQEADGTLTVGISHAAQEMLGDVVFCGDAKVGDTLSAGTPCAVVESVKAASDIYIPVDGEVLAFNDALNDDPSVLNSAPYEAWVVKVKPSAGASMDHLLTAQAYQASL